MRKRAHPKKCSSTRNPSGQKPSLIISVKRHLLKLIAQILRALFLPYRSKMLGNTQSITCAFETSLTKKSLRNLCTLSFQSYLKKKDRIILSTLTLVYRTKTAIYGQSVLFGFVWPKVGYFAKLEQKGKNKEKNFTKRLKKGLTSTEKYCKILNHH